jgi:hypothetical protein
MNLINVDMRHAVQDYQTEQRKEKTRRFLCLAGIGFVAIIFLSLGIQACGLDKLLGT